MSAIIRSQIVSISMFTCTMLYDWPGVSIIQDSPCVSDLELWVTWSGVDGPSEILGSSNDALETDASRILPPRSILSSINSVHTIPSLRDDVVESNVSKDLALRFPRLWESLNANAT